MTSFSTQSIKTRAAVLRSATLALQAETEAQAGVNPLINDFGEAQERAKTAAELLAKAQQSGTAAGKELASVSQLLSGDFDHLSPAAKEQAQNMLALASGYAKAKAESEKLQQSQEKIKQSAQEWSDAAKDASEGFVKDLIAGKSASEALSNALQKLADKLLDSAFDSLFGGSGGTGGGLFSSIGSFLGLKNGGAFNSGGVHAFANGGAFSNQIVNTPTLFKFAKGTGMMGEAGPEAVMPLTRDSGGRLGVAAHGFDGGGSSGDAHAVFAPTYNVTGYGKDIDDLKKQMAKDQADFHAKVVTSVRSAKKTRQLN